MTLCKDKIKMLNNNFFKLGTVALFLSSTLLEAGTSCTGGACFVTLDNLKPSQGFEKNNKKLLVLEQPRYLEEVNANPQNHPIDRSMTIVLDGETITVFPHSAYVADGVEYDNSLVIAEPNKIEDTILEKTELPNSEFFCEKDTKPLYHLEDDTFECV